MKRLILSALLLALATGASFTQDATAQRRVREQQQQSLDLPKFDLDFPGGTPQDLVDAIRETGTTLNAIVPEEYKSIKLPPLKMRQVNAKQLFDALEMASQKILPYQTGSISPSGVPIMNERIITAGFRTIGPIVPEAVWSFHVQKPQTIEPPKIVRYYQLSPYLTEYKIDDITTAIQAGWKMLGETDMPKLNFNQDTKLLIAVGQLSHLTMIDSVLTELAKALPPEARGGIATPLKPKPERGETK